MLCVCYRVKLYHEWNRWSVRPAFYFVILRDRRIESKMALSPAVGGDEQAISWEKAWPWCRRQWSTCGARTPSLNQVIFRCVGSKINKNLNKNTMIFPFCSERAAAYKDFGCWAWIIYVRVCQLQYSLKEWLAGTIRTFIGSGRYSHIWA